MQFDSLPFLVFFPIVFVLYYTLFRNHKTILILISSIVFCSYLSYSSGFILVFSSIYFYYAGIKMEKGNTDRNKKILIISVVFSLLIIVAFKYINFANQNIQFFAKLINWNYEVEKFHLIIPLGISFYLLQGISYLIEIKRERIKPEYNYFEFASYIAYFPKLPAGPIERPYNLLPQLKNKTSFNYCHLSNGFKYILYGMLIKVVIADRLALFTNQVFATPKIYEGISLIIGVVFFAFQVYTDFAGYTYIAMGLSLFLGIKLSNNFDKPYMAVSISDFWNKWHITFSRWLRDYIFLPLNFKLQRQLSRANIVKRKYQIFIYVVSTIITMLICGIWHGSNWTFVLWGGIHGVYLSLSLIFKKIRMRINRKLKLNNAPKVHKLINIITTFVFISISWTFFRAN